MASAIPNNGKNRKGISAVTAKFTASVNHHVAIHTARPAIYVTVGTPGFKSRKIMIRRASTGPARIEINLFRLYPFTLLVLSARTNVSIIVFFTI